MISLSEEIQSDIERAVRASAFASDFFLLLIISDTTMDSTEAWNNKDYKAVVYYINQGFWNVGVYILNKLSTYSSVLPSFFDDMASNIKKHLNKDINAAFSPDNLKRCLKLVSLTNKTWFAEVARNYNWAQFVDALDQSNSFEELKSHLNKMEIVSYIGQKPIFNRLH